MPFNPKIFSSRLGYRSNCRFPLRIVTSLSTQRNALENSIICGPFCVCELSCCSFRQLKKQSTSATCIARQNFCPHTKYRHEKIPLATIKTSFRRAEHLSDPKIHNRPAQKHPISILLAVNFIEVF